MFYPPLPEHEQIRRKKEVPKWYLDPIMEDDWNDKAKKEEKEKYKKIIPVEAILSCLREYGPMNQEEIIKKTHKDGSNFKKWLNILQMEGKITFDMEKRSKMWRLVGPNEVIARVVSHELKGHLQIRTFDYLLLVNKDPDKWATVHEIAKAISVEKDSRITLTLESLLARGAVKRKPREDKPNQRKAHPWVYRAQLPNPRGENEQRR